MRLENQNRWWLIRDTPSLFTDLYELTMAQAYFAGNMRNRAFFEVTIRRLPENWGFFVMAGLQELEGYLNAFRFAPEDIEYLRSTKLFSGEFLTFLSNLKIDVRLRALPEGTVFFPNEPVLEVESDLICAQLLETYILNILGFSIISATLASRVILAARGVSVVDFGLRRSQSPIAALRAARAAQIAGFAATSNLYAAELLDFTATGTMAHSFVEVHESEEQSFLNYARLYGEKAIFLIDTYEPTAGIITAAKVASRIYKENGVKVAGIRIDSGPLVKLSRFARTHFEEAGVPFLKIFVSGDLDEYAIADLLENGAEIDGIGIGTRFAVSRYAPSLDIVYKIVRYADRDIAKTSPEKQSRPGRKTITRYGDKTFEKDIVSQYEANENDLLKPFITADDMPTIQSRLAEQLSHLPSAVKQIKNPEEYPVIFA
jgi:nicotinate phosphoribosyltransferase